MIEGGRDGSCVGDRGAYARRRRGHRKVSEAAFALAFRAPTGAHEGRLELREWIGRDNGRSERVGTELGGTSVWAPWRRHRIM